MKKFKKLIPAFCAMLVSAAMLGTSTYAWFSVNKEVSANGMSVTAQANTQYFVVLSSVDGGFTAEGSSSSTTTAAALASGGIKNGNSDNATSNVFPVAYTTESLYLASDNERTTPAVNGSRWYTGGVSADSQTSNENSQFVTLTEIGADSLNTFSSNRDYFVGYKFYVGLADKTDSCKAKLKFTPKSATNAAKIAGFSVKSSAAGSEAKHVSYANGTDAVESTDSFAFIAKNDSVNAQYVEVIVYVYIDGTDAEIMSKNLKAGGNAAKLTGSIGVDVEAVITQA